MVESRHFTTQGDIYQFAFTDIKVGSKVCLS